jgi:hypothetical protein
MSKAKDIVGQKFGRLTILRKVKSNKYRQARCECECDCGNKVIVLIYNLKNKKTKSCGCLQKEEVKKRFTKHGMKKYPLYDVWSGMRKRCCNPRHAKFKIYGARGIKICDEWINNPEIFIEWALSNGWEKGLQIDRIDNDGDYEPNNCRFVTARENNSNKQIHKTRNLPVGVNKYNHRFQARCSIDGKSKYLGIFDTPEEASQYRQKFLEEKDLL